MGPNEQSIILEITSKMAAISILLHQYISKNMYATLRILAIKGRFFKFNGYIAHILKHLCYTIGTKSYGQNNISMSTLNNNLPI